MAVVCCHAPEAVATPGAFLAFLGAVLGATAATTFGELTGEFFPFAALPVGALADAAARVVFAAEVAHNDAGPVGHIVVLGRDGV